MSYHSVDRSYNKVSKTYPNPPAPFYPDSYSYDHGISNYPAESNYANIQINIAPPTPTSKDLEFKHLKNDPNQSRDRYDGSNFSTDYYEGRSSNTEQERPLPGPMVPPNEQNYAGGALVSSPHKQEKEAEVDALTDLLVKNLTSAGQEGDDEVWGMCGSCSEEISSEANACSALDNVYHVQCFTCVVCHCPLQSVSFFAVESKPYCEHCYINTLEKCSVCSQPISDRLLRATGKPYHPDCFTCVVCAKSLDGIPFTVDATNQIHCIEDFHKKFAPRCCVCNKPIMPTPGQEETVRIVAMDKSFHVDCYRCEDCHCQLSSEAEGRGCYPLDDHILCKNCNARRIQILTSNVSTEL